MAVFTPPFVLPVMAAISSRESPVARNCSTRLVPAGSRSSALSAILSASDCSIIEEASLPSDNHSGYTSLLTGPFLRQSEMQLFFAVDTAQASALRICTPSRLATQSRSNTSCTTSSGSPSNRDARKNFSAVARIFGLIAASSVSSVFSILHRHRRKNREKSRGNSNFLLSPSLLRRNSWKNCTDFRSRVKKRPPVHTGGRFLEQRRLVEEAAGEVRDLVEVGGGFRLDGRNDRRSNRNDGWSGRNFVIRRRDR